MTKGRIIRLSIGILCLLAALAIGIYVFVEFYRRYAAEKAMKDLVPQTSYEYIEEVKPPVVDNLPELTPLVPEEEPVPQVEVPEKVIDWNALHETNSHIYAWLYVPETNVDYPVLQHPDEDYYYLNRNMDGSKGYPGCIYSEKSFNGKDFSDAVTVLYGHNMKNGTMFRTLHNFENEEFFNGEHIIYIYTENGNYAYEVIGAFELDDRHLLHGWDFTTGELLPEYQNVLKRDGKGHFKDVEITENDKLIILSTCVNSGRNEVRYMVEGRLLGRTE